MKRKLVSLAFALLWVGPAVADDPRTFCGKTLNGWILQLRNGSSAERDRAVWALAYFGPMAKKAVPDLIKRLREAPTGRSGDACVEALGQIGPDAAAAVPLIIPRFLKRGCDLTSAGTFIELVHGNPKIALERIGAPAVPELIPLMNGPDVQMRPCAAEVLAAIGPGAKDAVSSLVRALQVERELQALEDLEPRILRRHAVMALGKIGPSARPAIPALKALLDREQSGDIDDNSQTLAEALTELGAPPVHSLVDAMLRNPESLATFILCRLGRKAEPAVPRLRRALTDPRASARINAAAALTMIAPTNAEAVPILVDALEHHPDEASRLIEALGQAGPAASAALPTLMALVTKRPVESAVIETIVRIDPEGKVCLPALVAALGGEAADCSAAASALGLFGPRAKSAIPALAKTIMRKLDWNAQIDNEGHPLVDAAKALWRIGPAATSTAIPTLIRAIESPRFITDGVLLQRDEEIDDKTAATAAHVLGLFGPEARQAVPVLIRCLEDLNNDQPNWELRREAALALGRIGPDAVSAIPILRTVLAEEIKSGHSETFADREMSISSAALIALWKLSPVDRARVENRLAESHSLTERAMVLGAIGRQSLEGELLTRRRVKALDNAIAEGKREGNMTPFVEEYFERISELGAGAHTAIPRLTELEKHENPWIRQWAGEALATIIRSNAAAR